MADAKGKKKPVVEIEDDELDIDDEMPEDDELDGDSESSDDLYELPDDSDEEAKDDDESDAEDDDEIDSMADVVVTQPTPASSEPPTVDTAYSLMDLVAASSEPEIWDSILEEANLTGKHAFWQNRQICAIHKQDDGLFTVYLWKGSVPGKSYNDIDGALDFEWRPSKTKLDFPISWRSDGGGSFLGKVCAFEGQPELGVDFEISAYVGSDTQVQVTTDHELSFDQSDLELYAKAAVWTAKVVSWFEKTHVEAEEADDGE